jgi:hypothetical protein
MITQSKFQKWVPIIYAHITYVHMSTYVGAYVIKCLIRVVNFFRLLSQSLTLLNWPRRFVFWCPTHGFDLVASNQTDHSLFVSLSIASTMTKLVAIFVSWAILTTASGKGFNGATFFRRPVNSSTNFRRPVNSSTNFRRPSIHNEHSMTEKSSTPNIRRPLWF